MTDTTVTIPVLDLNRAVDPDPASIARRLRRAFERLQEDREETIDEVILLLEDAVLDRELAIRSRPFGRVLPRGRRAPFLFRMCRDR